MKTKTPSSSLARLSQRFRGQGALLMLALIGTVVQVSLTVYLPVLIGQAIDTVVRPNSNQLLSSILVRMVLVIGLNTAIQWLNPILFNRLIYQVVAKLREDVLFKLHHLPLSYIDRQSIGDLVSRVTTDSEQLTNGLLMIFNQFFLGILTILLTIFSMGRLDMLMLLLVIGLTPLSLLIARFISQKSYRLYQEQTRARGQQTELLEEVIGQQALVQQFNAQAQKIDIFRNRNAQYSDATQDAIFYSSTIFPTTRFVNALIYALLAGVGALRIMKGQFTVGQLTTFLNYATQYTKPFNDISSVFAELQSALACAERLFAVLDEQALSEDHSQILDSHAVQGAIDFENVQFGYVPNRILIKNLNLSIPAGSKVGIVGPTGAGKSTMINLLMRFYEVNQGQILLDGIPITQYSREDFRQQIGMVLQETWLKAATIHDNIAYGLPNASRKAVIEAAKAANADFFIRQLPQGYDTYLEDAGASLSQGQAQLLSIARVFLKQPKILILDEATSSIDTRTEMLIQKAFQKLMTGRTSFVIAHRLSTIEDADMILVMVDGDIVESGNHAQLMALKGVYHQMQTAQETLA
ncbi:ABC transporter ATP-binding protein [Streptococcus merionis]|uniref:Multidrug ABC transporter ATPase and permease n=1 Tax=Streptococcus merionis TaxID=400065 RepID=A0A239SSY9_9STRE|nr:ABC transporter ATP-binding protein [Streptococcus merionis]SNU87854.1 multidrug ABC transporter ATPase and permease [Streptococcus merionis]